LEKRVAEQDERIAQLERRVGRSSRNSSQPPSADPPGGPPKRGKDRSARKQGAQPGHEGKGRPLLPAWAVDEVVEHWPTDCGCGHVFAEAERVSSGQPARHQVEELPVIAVTVTEHQCQHVRCTDCGQTSTAVLPVEVACSAFGPRLQAAIVTLSVRNRISRRDVVELCEQLFSSRISTGTIDAILTRAGDALAEPYADLLDRVRDADALNMDETGWRLKGAQRALWGAFTEQHAVFAIAPSRHEDHARDLLADTNAIVTSDRWWAYSHLPVKRRQICWSHLQRDFAAHADGLAAEKQLGEAGLKICDELFWAWEIYQHTGDRAELKRRTRKLRRELKAILTQHAGKDARYRYTRRFARNLLKVWPALWTFDSIEGVQPTNNHAERGLRGAVIYRKLSLGSQSEGGQRRIERLLSAHTTCRLQRRSLHTYLVDLLGAHARGDPIPLLA
ncbi:MAG: IS66 family transposase, partial [Actinomycetota bacterium]|nr:IS66 family transposase [Actinomycetota bacterium]